jgi:uncharacterized membrane protein YfcA
MQYNVFGEAGLIAAFAIFLLAGLVKGFTGVGLPMVAIPLLSMIINPATAITIVVGPAAASNVVQSLRGGYLPALLSRFWSLCLALIVVIGVTTPFIIGLDTSTLMLVVGSVVFFGALVQLMQPSFRIPKEKERFWNPIAGSLGGLICGGANLHGGTMAIYFLAVGLERDRLVAAIGMVFVVGAFPIYAAYFAAGRLSEDVLLATALALVPALAGQWCGAHFRQFVPHETFRRIVLVFFLIGGLDMVRRGFF